MRRFVKYDNNIMVFSSVLPFTCKTRMLSFAR